MSDNRKRLLKNNRSKKNTDCGCHDKARAEEEERLKQTVAKKTQSIKYWYCRRPNPDKEAGGCPLKQFSEKCKDNCPDGYGNTKSGFMVQVAAKNNSEYLNLYNGYKESFDLKRENNKLKETIENGYNGEIDRLMKIINNNKSRSDLDDESSGEESEQSLSEKDELKQEPSGEESEQSLSEKDELKQEPRPGPKKTPEEIYKDIISDCLSKSIDLDNSYSDVSTYLIENGLMENINSDKLKEYFDKCKEIIGLANTIQNPISEKSRNYFKNKKDQEEFKNNKVSFGLENLDNLYKYFSEDQKKIRLSEIKEVFNNNEATDTQQIRLDELISNFDKKFNLQFASIINIIEWTQEKVSFALDGDDNNIIVNKKGQGLLRISGTLSDSILDLKKEGGEIDFNAKGFRDKFFINVKDNATLITNIEGDNIQVKTDINGNALGEVIITGNNNEGTLLSSGNSDGKLTIIGEDNKGTIASTAGKSTVEIKGKKNVYKETSTAEDSSLTANVDGEGNNISINVDN